jgi:putative ABC transport system substrate-binding protein
MIPQGAGQVTITIGRREFVRALGGAAAASVLGPLAARAQQPGMPVIGFLLAARQNDTDLLADLQQGLRETGFIEGRNFATEIRSAEGQYDRLPALAADLVRRRVAVIFATGTAAAPLAAKAATATIPIVFAIGTDPVKFGLVASLSRPGGNVTGVAFSSNMLGPKRLELLREMLPKAAVIAFLVNPDNPNAESDAADMQAAGQAIGVRIVVVRAGSERDLVPAFATIVKQRADGLIVNTDIFLSARSAVINALSLRDAIPTMVSGRGGALDGALVSYAGGNNSVLVRQAGIYVGRILKGEKPADLPIQQTTKFDLIVNLKTAKALGLTVPESFLLRADEVIE